MSLDTTENHYQDLEGVAEGYIEGSLLHGRPSLTH